MRDDAQFYELLELVGLVNVTLALRQEGGDEEPSTPPPPQQHHHQLSDDESRAASDSPSTPESSQWTLTCSDKTGEVLANGLTLRAKRHNGVIAFGSHGYKRGVHEFTVRYDSPSDALRVGVAVRNHGARYALRASGGAARESNRPNVAEIQCSRPLRPGDLVSVRLDMEARTLTFGLNGCWNAAPAFTDLELKTWYPYVKTGHNASVTLVKAT